MRSPKWVRRKAMAGKFDPNEIVDLQEIIISNAIQIEALTQMLLERGLFSEEELFATLRAVEERYHGAP
jgi:hypothetical protein